MKTNSTGPQNFAARERKEHKEPIQRRAETTNREPHGPHEKQRASARRLRNHPFAYLASFAVTKSGLHLCVLCVLWWLSCDVGFEAFAATRYVWQESPSPAPPYTTWATAAHIIQDAVDAADPGDTVLVTNGVYATGGRAVYGTMTNRVAVDKPLNLLSVNGPEVTLIQGYQVPGMTNGDGAIRCVYLSNGASLAGFTLTNGATRVVDDAPTYRESAGGGVWCESTNALIKRCFLRDNSALLAGGGSFGGQLDACVIADNSVGEFGGGGGAAQSSLIGCVLTGNTANAEGAGGGASGSRLVSCLVASNSAAVFGGGVDACTLENCILTGNTVASERAEGGGASFSTLFNCRLTGNVAVGDLAQGGGVANSALWNCTLMGNKAAHFAGGTFESSLFNCTVAGNSAQHVGGVYGGASTNCVIYHNSAPDRDEHDGFSPVHSSCTTPLPWNGADNTTNAPLFVDTNGWSNLRLQSNSPCINAGNNASVNGSTDLDGRPRIVGGTVDMGAYEFQGPGLSEFIGWLAQYHLPTDGSADAADTDADGHNSWQEWKAWTVPTNALSVLKLLTPQPQPDGLLLTWQSVAGQTYSLERAASASGPFSLLQTNLPGQAGTTSFTDTNRVGGGSILYRVGVPE
jgi:hypothetical protein